MITEFIKVLIDVPEKLTGSLIRIAKITCSLMFAAKLYSWWIGDYVFIQLTDLPALVNFFLGGRVLLCLLLYAISYLVLFNLLSVISSAPLEWYVVRRFNKIEIDKHQGESIRRLLGHFHLLSINKASGKIKYARNTPKFYDILKKATKEKTKRKMSDLKSSFIGDVWHIYFVFAIFYFVYLQGYFTHHQLLTILVITGCVLLPICYLLIAYVFVMITDASKEMIGIVHFAIINNQIEKTLRECGVFQKEVHPESNFNLWEITHNSTSYYVYHHLNIVPVKRHVIEKIEALMLAGNKGLLMVTNRRVSSAAKPDVDRLAGKVFILNYQDKDKLVSDLKEIFS